ncbi:MAG: AmmeMemoRadiSam system protein B [Actinomycetota bacterium]|nr:AmmeMemoRadiSam system protein B [Actinomycetota bacterium]MDD5666162.1 AmmeMemoRadiSam system protein B [Actinomycetota bacterium]
MEVPEYPRLRRLEAIPAKQQGRDVIALRDPEGYMRGMVALPPPIYFIASLCDGTRSLRDLQAAYVRRFGDIITSDQVAAVVAELAGKLLLDDDNFRAYKRRLEEEYLSLPNRPMTSAGSGYAADPRELVGQVRSMLQGAGEPRVLDGAPLGVVAPHIDLERGRGCYGKLYSSLAASIAPDAKPLVVILGTCHGEMEGPFALTRKNYLTPFGMVETDAGLAEGIARAAGMDGLGDELSHRSEHSIEIQLPLLSVVFGGADRFRLLPVTCNSFHPFIADGRSPADDPEVGAFIGALKGLLSAMEGKAIFLASADLAHVGRRFGSLMPLDAVLLSSTMARDREMLERVEAGDAEGFYGYIAAEKDARHVCGLPPIYTVVKLLEGRRGELIDYCHWFDQAEGSAVTFAGLVIPG